MHNDVLKSGNILHKWGFRDSQSSNSVLTLASLANHSQEPSDLAVTQSEQWINLAQLEHWLGLNLGLEYWQSELFLDLSTQF